MTQEMREKIFTLHARLEYDLQNLRSRNIVNTHNLYFVAAMGTFVVVLISTAGYYYFRGLRSSQASWEELLAKLARIDRDNIA